MVAALPPTVDAAVHASPSAAPVRWTAYTVRSGDTLDAIAARTRTTVSALVARNHIRNPNLIHIGDRIQVPSATRSPKSPSTSPATTTKKTPTRTTSSSASPQGTVYTVRSGDTLSGIATRYRTTVAAIVKANRISVSAFIHPGQRLVVRGGPATKSTPAKAAPAKPAAKPTSAPRKKSVVTTPTATKYPQAVADSAARNRDLLAGMDVPSKTQVKAMIVETARRHGVDAKLALAIAYQESGWNHRAVSPANAVGVMQVIPIGGQWASELVGRKLNLLDPQDNITAGVVMLRALGRSTSSMEMAIGAYYQGLYSVQTRGMYSETQRYVANVLALRERM